MDARRLLAELFHTMVQAASAEATVPAALPAVPKTGRTLVVGAGKAAAAMAASLERHWAGPLAGLVVTRHGHGLPTRSIRVVEAAHPIPDSNGQDAARRILDAAQSLGVHDLMICLLSGGGSALLAVPADGITLHDKQETTRALLRSGAAIDEINCVRKHLSAIKGGRLAVAAAPATVVSLAISDVVGDDPSVIASGPTVADPTTSADALRILERHAIALAPSVRSHLTGPCSETPKPDHRALIRPDFRLIATPAKALAAAARAATDLGIRPVVLGCDVEGEARDLGRTMAATAMAIRSDGGALPAVILSGGEATVSVRGNGRGGPNGEFALALAIALDGARGVFGLAADTDGIDGTEDNAGAFVSPDTLRRAAQRGLDPVAYLADNHSHGFFGSLGDLFVTGPTRTNVNDFRAVLIQ